MFLENTIIYLFAASGVVLLFWVGGLMWLTLALRSKLKTVSAERDVYARHAKALLAGQTVTVSAGDYAKRSGQVLWLFEDEVCINSGDEQIRVLLADVVLETGDRETGRLEIRD